MFPHRRYHSPYTPSQINDRLNEHASPVRSFRMARRSKLAGWWGVGWFRLLVGGATNNSVVTGRINAASDGSVVEFGPSPAVWVMWLFAWAPVVLFVEAEFGAAAVIWPLFASGVALWYTLAVRELVQRLTELLKLSPEAKGAGD